MMSNKPNGTLYIGVTSDLIKRIWEHKNFTKKDCFTAKYKLTNLVYYEIFDAIEIAIQREKTMKHWIREWKINKIESINPNWCDLYDTII